MRPIALAALLLVPNMALADFSLEDLVGKWKGQGSYVENATGAKMRCKLEFAGGADEVSVTGRCASGLGAQKVAMDLIRAEDGSISAVAPPGAPKNKTDIDGLSGTPNGQHLVMNGAAGEDSVKMEFLMNADGTLRFGVHSVIGAKESKSVIVLTR